MPFKKSGKDDYISPSGRHFNKAQVQKYYAGGFKVTPHEKMEKSMPHEKDAMCRGMGKAERGGKFSKSG